MVIMMIIVIMVMGEDSDVVMVIMKMELSPGDRQPSMVCAGAEVHWGADQGGLHSSKGLCHRHQHCHHRHQLCDHCHQLHYSLACHGRDEGRSREGSTARRFLHCPGD